MGAIRGRVMNVYKGIAVAMAVMLLAVVGFVVRSTPVAAADQPGKAAVRLGVFDPRAIAVAYAPSRYNTVVQQLQPEYEKAKAAGDKATMARLRKEGQAAQEKLHKQGFEGAPVDDLLAYVKDQLPAVCADTGVDAIVTGVVHGREGVEVVDVTDRLVQCYEPSEKTLKTVAEVRAHPLEKGE